MGGRNRSLLLIVATSFNASAQRESSGSFKWRRRRVVQLFSAAAHAVTWLNVEAGPGEGFHGLQAAGPQSWPVVRVQPCLAQVLLKTFRGTISVAAQTIADDL